jgi:aldose 1-epimerase
MQFAFRARWKPLAACGVVALILGGSVALARPNHHHGSAGPKITSTDWGTVNGTHVNLWTLTSGRGMTVTITDFGATVVSISVPDRAGHTRNVALGFPSLSDYVNDFMQQHTGVPWPLPGGSGDVYFGATIGRYANRIANHSFTMECTNCSNNGVTYTLPANNGTNTLHGGDLGWNTKVWTPSTPTVPGAVALKETLTSPDGDEGFPASVTASVTYIVDQHNKLRIEYSAKNDESAGGKATVINLTNHTYFNLAGEGSGNVLNQRLSINGNKYSPIDTSFIPENPFFQSVAGTPFDFRHMKPIGQDITNLNEPDGVRGTPYGPTFHQLVIAHGYDHNWVLNGSGNRLVSVAQDPKSGITLWTYTDQPGVQVYTGNFLVGDLSGPSGHAYRQTSAFTLETQHFPDTPHHIGDPAWPSVVLNAGDTFTSTTTYGFTTAGRGLPHHGHF